MSLSGDVPLSRKGSAGAGFHFAVLPPSGYDIISQQMSFDSRPLAKAWGQNFILLGFAGQLPTI